MSERIDYFDRDAFCFESLGRLEGFGDHQANRDNGHIRAFALDVTLANRHQVFFFRNLFFGPPQTHMLEDEHRIIIADSAL